ncbi:Phosphate acetyltransferase [Stieleria maiorica]|uniref:Phosphate acetyltransferase n=1 Tax=Stieleria maiorica TaxID=2795974 RepID=A0A5B9MIC3_9BACT|nr:phosphate acetyltransferase [Stieleria maiorica]QEF98757.1 Phosphate acetyltransferase [Stieleria maiorica]
MAQSLYIAASEPDSGKSLVVLGIMEMLSRRVERLGFFRPIIRSDGKRDNDTELLLKRYSLSQSYEQSYAFPSDEAEEIATEKGLSVLLRIILEKYKAIEAQCDFVLCEGTDFDGVTSAFDFDLSAQIATHLGTPVLNVLSGRNKSPESIRSAAHATRIAMIDEGCTVTANIVNRVAAEQMDAVRDEVRKSWDYEDPILFVADEPTLESPTVGAVAEALGAVPIRDCEMDLNREIRTIAVAAMQLPHFLQRVQENKLVITPGDRSDILLGCLATVASDNYPQISGIVLTGGMRPPESVTRLIEGIRRPLIPTFAVDTDTYETVRNVMAVEGVISADNERKIQAALGVFESSIDPEVLFQRIDVARSRVVTPAMFEYELIEQAKRKRQRIVLPEGEEERILRATEILRRRDVAEIVLLGNPAKIRTLADELAIDLTDVEIIDPSDNPYLDSFARTFYQLRQHKGVTEDQAHDTVQDVSYFGTMMVYAGIADGMVSGSAHTTAHTIRPALQIIRTKPGCSIVSSVFLMCLKDRVLVYGDCAINPRPNPAELADIAISSAGTAKAFGIEPVIAMLSYSTGQSGSGEEVERVKQATALVRQARPDLLIEGPIQYDAAIDPGVAKTKLPDSQIAGRASVFIFPDLNTGNNTYKAVQRAANAVAIGPVLQGLKKPVNDLSRGCTVIDIVNTVAITAIQSQRHENGDTA